MATIYALLNEYAITDEAYANLSDTDLRDVDIAGVELTGAKLPMQFAEAPAGEDDLVAGLEPGGV